MDKRKKTAVVAKRDKNREKEISVFLPDVIIENILSRLSVKLLLRFRCVCKSWNALIRDDCFISQHLYHYNKNSKDLKLVIDDDTRAQLPEQIFLRGLKSSVYIGFAKLRVRGSRNGLLLLCRGSPASVRGVSEQLWLLNPSTREKRKLPMPPSNYIGDEASDVHYGFGYSESSKDYKIVRIRSFFVTREHAIPAEFTVFSLRRNTWTRVPSAGNSKSSVPSSGQHIPYINMAIDGALPDRREVAGVFFNGALHWVAVDIPMYVDGENVGGKGKHIISFHIEDETIGEVPCPFSNGEEFDCIRVYVFDGKLCFISFSVDDCHVWVMTNYGLRESWSRLLSIKNNTLERSYYFRPLLFTKKGDGILVYDGSLHICNLNDKRLKRLCKIRRPGGGREFGITGLLQNIVLFGHQATVYLESLVPLYTANGSEQEGLEEKENFYLFSKEKFRLHTTSQEGNIRVLERFIHGSNILEEAEKYGVTFIEACPYTVMIPHCWNVNAVFVVLCGGGVVTLVKEGIIKETTYKLERGDSFKIYSGTTLYIINGDNSENLYIAVLTRSYNTHNQFEPSRNHLRNLFEGQMDQGPILKVSQEQIHALHGFSSNDKIQSNKLLNLLNQIPSCSNQFGRLYETTTDDYGYLDITVSFAQITRGSQFGPYCNSKSTSIALVVNGIGCFGIFCLKGKTCCCCQSGSNENRTGQVSRGDVLVVPVGHCVVLQAPEDQNVDVVYFEVNAKGNKLCSLARVSDQFKKGSTSLIVPEEDLAALYKKVREEGPFGQETF